MLALEKRFPAWVETAAPPDGIIVLGGPVRIGLSSGPRQRSSWTAAPSVSPRSPALARRYPNARIVFTGGSGQPDW